MRFRFCCKQDGRHCATEGKERQMIDIADREMGEGERVGGVHVCLSTKKKKKKKRQMHGGCFPFLFVPFS